MKQDIHRNTEFAKKFIQHITNGCWPDGDMELDQAASMISRDYEYQLLPKSLNHPILKWPAHREWLAKTIRTAGFTEFRMEIVQTTAEDNRVAMETVSRAISADGRPYSNQYRFTITFDDEGMICREVEFLDSLYVSQFIGSGDIGVKDHQS